MAVEQPVPAPIHVRGCSYDGLPHWQHPALLLHQADGLIVTQTAAGVEIATTHGPWHSPYDSRGHYWAERWFNAIRLEEPGKGLFGWYCNIATPAELDGASLRYVDLQLDVRVYAEAAGLRYEVVDEDEFEAARARFHYPDELVARCRGAVEELIALVTARAFPFDT